MKMLSGKSVLIAVFLQLCYSAHVVKADYQFGDLLEFPRVTILGKPLYKHYAVYVGGEDVKGKEKDQNIFEMLRDPPGCRFDKQPGPFTVVNSYYDKNHKVQTKDFMIKKIEELMSDEKKCKKYSLLNENCEHIATEVRYNEAFCNQPGAIIG